MTENIPGLAARRGAFKLLAAVLWQHRPLDMALDRALSGLEGPDRALARAIASQTLRWMVDFDQAIDACTRKPLPHDARARLVLRMALAQLWVLKTPAHAVVSTALPLVEAGPRRLVHGVLGRLIREDHALPAVPRLPAPYADRWREAYGADAVAAIAQAAVAEAPLDIVFRSPEDEARWAPALGGERLAPGTVRLTDWQEVEALPGYGEGAWWVQDLAAQLPARLLQVAAGETVADLCAAPGGKTLQLAAAGARVTAVDVSEARLRRVTENLERTGLAAETIARDARKWKAPAPLDALVLDAPCSATGTLRRHPDVLHLKGARTLTPLLDLQAELLDHALDQLRPGGRMVYAVCSLEPEEGERQIEALLARRADVALDPVAPEEIAGIEALFDPRGWVRTLPGMMAGKGGLDGFFMARLLRRTV
ncbi:RsmB/NOP family class I SAM-dependent RNA methyltransferase [Pedomonas sp. V897]|uniref:RsmB/NOP family class I SAM-dependent RNA methyltransferase n=1 Tax=Pedomonas sp. V897 TaxID=3446482 RepID=UPI003EE4106B